MPRVEINRWRNHLEIWEEVNRVRPDTNKEVATCPEGHADRFTR
jgi:hypothetical protein